MALRYGLDTNILVRLARATDPQHALVSEAVRRLTEQGAELGYTPQNIGEFWNVSTRPVERNGFGLSTEEALEEVRRIEQNFILLPENIQVYEVWRRLLATYDVRGVQVHDAHLAAILEVHDVRHLLTFNGRDFVRFSFLVSVHPAEI